jgi:hypothetical protein
MSANFQPWTNINNSNGTPTVIDVKAPTSYWVGLQGNTNARYWAKTKWVNERDGTIGAVSGLSLTDDNHIWIVSTTGRIDNLNNTAKRPRWINQFPVGAAAGPALKSIVMTGTGGPGGLVQLDGASAPDSAAAGVNYVSLTGSGFPGGNITPGNVVVALATQCRGAAGASTAAVSVVSASPDRNLISFLLPSGLAPGQYFVSISDFEEGDANFESNNCSAVNVAQ